MMSEYYFIAPGENRERAYPMPVENCFYSSVINDSNLYNPETNCTEGPYYFFTKAII